MKPVRIILRRELASYFATPLAYVFIVIFLVLAGVCAFSFGALFERGQADLVPLFSFLPWLYLFLVPAVAMRLWAEELKTGSIELLLTQPITVWQAVLGKFFAAWLFVGIALVLTFPTWITINYLGDPDNGTILAGYVGSFLMAGGFLAIGACVSALTKNQVIAFVISVALCLVFLFTGFPPFIDFFSGWAPGFVIDAIASFSFFTHFDGLSKGLIEARDLVFFASLIALSLLANALILEAKKAE